MIRSSHSGGRLSRLIVAAFVLVLAAVSFAQARPYTLQWDANTDGVTTGYLVSYGTAPGVYGATDNIDAGNVTSFQVDLVPGTTYYFSVKAYNSDNIAGLPSAELSFFVPLDPTPTLNVSATSVGVGGSVSAILASGPGGRFDLIGLYAVGSNTRLDWRYLNGTQTAPAIGLTAAAVAFTMPTTAGQYQFRFFPNNATTATATSATVTVTGGGGGGGTPTLTPSSTSVAGGATVSATLANGPGGRFDLIGLYAVGSSTRLDWKYLNGTQTAPATGVTAATVPFTMPTTAGQYQFRFFPNNATTATATSATVTVTGTGGGGGGTPTLTPSSTSVTGGASVSATLANGPGGRYDLIGLFAVGAANDNDVDWKYLNGTQSAPATGMTAATVAFTMPTTPGQYQFRFFLDNSYTVTATSATVTVTGTGGGGGTPTLTPSSTNVGGGASVSAILANGPGGRYDLIGLFAVGAANDNEIAWKYLNGTQTAPATGVTAATVPFTMPTTAGQYQFRFFLDNSYTVTATSATVTVTGGGGGGGGTPTITPSSTSVAGGTNVTATIANGPGFRLDWAAVCPAGNVVTGCTDWKYMNGTRVAPATGLTGAVLTFTMPTTSGQYTLKFFKNDTMTLLATSVPVTVTGTGGGGGGSPTITPSSTTVAPGSTLTATIANGPGNRLDWVAVCPPTSSSGCFDWKYLNGTRVAPTVGLTAATVTFTMPTTTGQFSLRFFRNDTLTLLATSALVTVTGVVVNPSITPDATTVAAGGTVVATIANGPGNRLDWVAVCPGSSTVGCTDWQYLNGTQVAPSIGFTAATLPMTMPNTSGSFRLRFFSNDTFAVLATSPTITVP